MISAMQMQYGIINRSIRINWVDLINNGIKPEILFVARSFSEAVVSQCMSTYGRFVSKMYS